jgi:predicted HTH domain antitoxin
MAFTISDKLLLATNLTEQEIATEIATILYHRGQLPVAAAAEVARMGRLQFQHLLASRDVLVEWADPIDTNAGSGIGAAVVREDYLEPGDGLGAAIIPGEVLAAAGLTDSDLATELAVVLYAREKLSLGRAAELAGMNKWVFNDLLAERNIPMHYDERELARDFATVRRLVAR